MRRSIKVSTPNAGRRVDAFLKRELASVPRHKLMKWLRTGVVRVNGKKVKPETRLAEGDEIGMPELTDESSADERSPSANDGEPIAESRSPRSARRPPKPDLVILYEDDDLLIVDKPAHLPAHAGTGHTDSLAARVAQYLDAEHAPVGHKPGLAQRLDSGVSGLVPIGKHAAALRVLAAAVAADQVRKIYQAIVTGELAEAHGDIRLALRIDDQPMGNRPRTHPDPKGLPAHSTFTRVDTFKGASLVDVEIHTGRTHQIRAHLKAIGHPLIGDPRYGSATADKKLGVTLARPALHARRLTLTHPTSGKVLVIDAPLPQDMARVLAALRKR
jgi:23S rRNA pseudouridine955/2504/2580 synthase